MDLRRYILLSPQVVTKTLVKVKTQNHWCQSESVGLAVHDSSVSGKATREKRALIFMASSKRT